MASPAIRIVPTVAAHVRDMGKCLREADRNELEAISFSASRALWRSFKGSLMRRTAFVNGKIAAMWGVGGVPMGDTGEPWLVTSDAVHDISALRFARIYQNEVHKMLILFPRLVNYVDYSYDKAMRLLDIIGFKISAPQQIGKRNELFCKFEIERRRWYDR